MDVITYACCDLSKAMYLKGVPRDATASVHEATAMILT